MANTAQQGMVMWQSPANIALIKYWGKKGHQLPANPSISFTLHHACTRMKLQWERKPVPGDGIDLTFFFEEKENPKFGRKISDFLHVILPDYPFLKELQLTIHSENSFPHSAGIASSASSMSALALCLCSLEQVFYGTLSEARDFFHKASYLARLASGSASRSVYGGLVTWGKIEGISYSSDEFATPLQTPVHPIFKNYHDTVLVVSRTEKTTSSRAGHALMDVHPFKKARYEQAHRNILDIIKAIETGDLDTFNRITEEEALTLHALMMTSSPSVLLLLGNSIEIIHRLRTFRAEKRLPVCFTIDAGPNIHVLYPDSAKLDVERWILSEMLQFCESSYHIIDHVGSGPQRLA
jgi:diphosphomevalonate decarboxylase